MNIVYLTVPAFTRVCDDCRSAYYHTTQSSEYIFVFCSVSKQRFMYHTCVRRCDMLPCLCYTYYSSVMAESIPIPSFQWSGLNVAELFKLFCQKMNLYFSVKGIPANCQLNHILLSTCDDGLKIFNAWALTDEQKKKLDGV